MPTKTKKLSAKQEKMVIDKIVLSSLSPAELTERANKLRKEIAKTRLEINIGRQRNVRKVFILRKELARVLTVLK